MDQSYLKEQILLKSNALVWFDLILQVENSVVKRVTLTLPEAIYHELESLAEIESRPISNMAYYLIVQALSKAKKEGVIQPQQQSNIK